MVERSWVPTQTAPASLISARSPTSSYLAARLFVTFMNMGIDLRQLAGFRVFLGSLMKAKSSAVIGIYE